jgi:hypothetical protein
MVRLPIPGSDDGNWGALLNDFLSVETDTTGALKIRSDGTLANLMHLTGDEGVAGVKTFAASPVVPTPTAATQVANKTYVDSVAVSGAANASAGAPGLIQLAGALAGTATVPTLAANSVTNATVSASAAIAKSKLASLAIVDADVSAISESKVTNLTSDLASKAPSTRTITAGTGLTGGGDLSADRTLAVTADSTTQRVRISNGGTLVGTRQELNLVAGSNVTITPTDDSGNNRVNVTIAASGIGGGGSVSTVSNSDGTITVTNGSGPTVTVSAAVGTTAGTVAAGNDARFTTIAATTQAGASYTLVLGDAGTCVEGTSASAQTFTIPPHSSVALAVGTVIEVFQFGSGQITVAAGAGVTLLSDGAKVATAGQYATISLRQRTTNVWVLAGDLA